MDLQLSATTPVSDTNEHFELTLLFWNITMQMCRWDISWTYSTACDQRTAQVKNTEQESKYTLYSVLTKQAKAKTQEDVNWMKQSNKHNHRLNTLTSGSEISQLDT